MSRAPAAGGMFCHNCSSCTQWFFLRLAVGYTGKAHFRLTVSCTGKAHFGFAVG